MLLWLKKTLKVANTNFIAKKKKHSTCMKKKKAFTH